MDKVNFMPEDGQYDDQSPFNAHMTPLKLKEAQNFVFSDPNTEKLKV